MNLPPAPPHVVEAARAAFRHNCKPNAALGPASPIGKAWTCPECGKQWRKGSYYSGWGRTA